MNFKPSDFFIGLVDFFSIILPGFIVSFMLRNELLKLLSLNSDLDGFNLSAFYFVSSYILGHFVYALGTVLRILFYESTKHLFYHKIRDWYVRKFLKNKKKPTVASWVLIEDLEEIKNETQLSEISKGRLKGFKWGKAVIEMKHPEMIQQINRLEADAKFFRSLVIVSLIAIGVTIFQGKGPELMKVTIWSLVLCFSFWRYINRQYNAEEEVSIIIHSMRSVGELASLQEKKIGEQPVQK
jgi:hypothetical protein